MRVLVDLFQSLSLLLPPWLVGLIAAILLVVAAPAVWDQMRIRQIRGLVRRRVRAEGAERARLAAEAIATAGQRRSRLVVLAQEAFRRDQRELFEAAAAALRAQGGPQPELAALTRSRTRDRLRFMDVDEALERVAQLRAEGLRVAADERLQDALHQFPGEPRLLALSSRTDPAEEAG